MLAAVAGTVAVATIPLWLWFSVEGNALWPGLALVLGLVLALVAVVLTWRWMRAAITGRHPDADADTRGRGTL